jgi:hypothetical protein
LLDSVRFCGHKEHRVKLLSSSLLLGAILVCCTKFGAVYPPRPPETPGEAIADPAPSRIVVHARVTSGAMKSELEKAVPLSGDGTFVALGGERQYKWTRKDLALEFANGHIVIRAKVDAEVKVPLGSVAFPLELKVESEPVVNTQYAVKLQSIDVKVTSTDTRLQMAEKITPVYEKIESPIRDQLKNFSYDLKPLLTQANDRIGKPTSFPVGDASGCAKLHLMSVEAGPTIVADGLEKDVALVVAPEVTLPCATDDAPAPVPDLANVTTIAPGPFTVTVPVAARYDELAKAMSVTFTNGKFFFSKDFPELYLEKPELYESQGQLVLKMHLQGPVHAHGIDTTLDGDLYFAGHPQVQDNELSIPDLEPTIETNSFLLALKAETDGAKIKEQARAAMRLDLADRFKAIKEKVSTDLTFGNERGCFKGTVDKLEVTGVHAHAKYLRAYVTVTARANVSMPCST